MDKSSHPCAFLESRERISDKTFDLSIPTLDKILSHFGVSAGIELSLGSKEHCFAKNSLKTSAFQVIPHQVITGEQGKKYCETLPAPFERHDLEFSGGMPIEKTNIESLNLPCHKGLHIIKA